jgi:hypothetical protein
MSLFPRAKRCLFTLSMLLLAFEAAPAVQAEPCLIGTLIPTANIATLNNDGVGDNLTKYAAVFHDIRLDPSVGCDTPALRAAFAVRLQKQKDAGGFNQFLDGGSLGFAYATAALLATRNELTQPMDDLLIGMPYFPKVSNFPRIEDYCGHTNGGWTKANDCNDIFTVAAEGLAWRAAYFKLSGRDATAQRAEAIKQINDSILDFDNSLCIHHPTDASHPFDAAGSGPCNATIAELHQALGDPNNRDPKLEKGTTLIPLHHIMEDANYGIGLMATIANAFLALKVSGQPVLPADYQNEQDFKDVMEALFRQGQRTAGPTPNSDDLCGLDSPSLAFSNLCFRPPTASPFDCGQGNDHMTQEDFNQRNRSCSDQRQGQYRMTLYPVARFYDDYGFKHDTPGFEFTGPQFAVERFKVNGHDSQFLQPPDFPNNFLGVARYEIYYVLTYKWLAEPLSVPAFNGFTTPVDCSTLKKAAAKVSGDQTIRAGGSATITATLDGAGPWTITWSDGEKDPDLIDSTFTRKVSPNATTTYSIVSIRGGGCDGTAIGSATVTIAESKIFVDSVTASSGIPATYSATLFSSSFTPIANAELVFTLFGEEIGRPRTDANGRASVVHTVDVEPGSYPTINVSFAGDATNPPASGSANLLVFCDSHSFIVRPEAFNFKENGGTVNVDIQTPGSCAWTATPSDPWITVAPTNGRGNGVLSIAVQPSTITRHGGVTLDGHVISIQQTVGCSYRFSPNGTYIAGDDDPNATSIMGVVAPDTCSWTVTTDHPEWLLLDTASGTGNGNIRFRVRQNDGGARVARLTIPNNGNDVTTFVNQYAAPPCTAPHLEIDAVDGTVKDGSNVVVAPIFSGTRLSYTIWINGFPVVESGLGQFFAARWSSFWPQPGQSVTVMLIAHNACGSASSTPVTWTNVTAPDATCLVPEFFFHPSGVNSPFPGASVELGVTATGPTGGGDPSLTYQWYQGTTGDRSSKVFNGTNDFVFVNPTTTTRYWVEIKDDCGTNISLPGTVFVTGRPRRRAVSHDFNGDGMADLVWHNEQTGQNELWSMFGTAHVGTVPLPAGDPHAELQSIGDFNGDSQPDLVFHDPATGANSVWEMNGTQLMSVQPLEPLPNWTVGAVADLDDDQNDDIVWHNGATGENQIWFQNGTQHTGTFSLPSSPDPNWGLHGAADFTHDGKPDLFFHNKATGENAIWIMNDAQPVTTSSKGSVTDGVSTTTVSRRNIQATVQSIESQPDTNWVPAQIVDLNNDGNPDIVWRNTVTGENSVWIMNGMTHTDTQQLETRSDPAWQIGGGGSTNAGTQTTPPDSRTATTISVTADPAPFNGATVITATLTSASGPVAGATLAFQLNGAEVARLVTDDQGTVIAAASVAGIAAGTYNNAISVHFGGDTLRAPSDASASLVVNGAQAAITWAYPADITYGQPLTAAQLNATANVAGSFTYSPAAGTVLSAGFHLLHATFTPSDPNIAAATKSVVLLVNKAGVTITWPPPAPLAFGTPLSATQLNATASVPGTFTYSPSFGAVLSLGAQTLNVAFTPNDTLNYASATSSTTINVIQGTQTIVWPAPQPLRVDDRKVNRVADATRRRDSVLAERPFFFRADAEDRVARLLVECVGLELDADAAERFERVGQQQELRFGVRGGALKGGRDPGPADLEAAIGCRDVRVTSAANHAIGSAIDDHERD